MSRLKQVKTGVLDAPMKIMIYGGEGVGKSTFASHAPKPIWLGADGGTGHLNVARLPEPQTWQDVLESIKELVIESHDYRTLVVDPVNWLERLNWDYIVKRDEDSFFDGKKKVKNIEDYGYFKGQKTIAQKEWVVLTSALTDLVQKRAMNVILVAHATVRKVKDPSGEDYDRYSIAMFEDAAAHLRQWVDYCLFARMRTTTKMVGAGAFAKYKGKSDGQRELCTTLNATYDAKSRPQLPDPLPLDWSSFMAARSMAAGRLDELKARVATLLEGAAADVVAKANAHILEDPGSPLRYEQIIQAFEEQSKPQPKAEQEQAS